jgi:hypothetical protein
MMMTNSPNVAAQPKDTALDSLHTNLPVYIAAMSWAHRMS